MTVAGAGVVVAAGSAGVVAETSTFVRGADDGGGGCGGGCVDACVVAAVAAVTAAAAVAAAAAICGDDYYYGFYCLIDSLIRDLRTALVHYFASAAAAVAGDGVA